MGDTYLHEDDQSALESFRDKMLVDLVVVEEPPPMVSSSCVSLSFSKCLGRKTADKLVKEHDQKGPDRYNLHSTSPATFNFRLFSESIFALRR